MLARMWDTDERQSLMGEKEEFKHEEARRKEEESSKVAAEEEAAAAAAILEKREEEEQFCGSGGGTGEPRDNSHLPPPVLLPAVPLASQASSGEDVGAQEKQEAVANEKDKFLGLKFSRSQSGNWKKAAKGEEEAMDQDQDDQYDEFESIRREVSAFQSDSSSGQQQPKSPSSTPLLQPPPPPPPSSSTTTTTLAAAAAGSDSDEEFSLKDVDTDRAVGSILEGKDDEEEEAEESESVLDLPNLEEAGDEDVQSAINSILDIQGEGGRIETPDFNNLAGLLDSIEADEAAAASGGNSTVGGGEGGLARGSGSGEGDGGSQDPVTEAAVNSIL